MEFTKNEVIQNDNEYIIYGKIQDKCAIIFSKKDVDENLKLNLSKQQFNEEDFWTFNINNDQINVVCQKDHHKDNPKDKYIKITENKDDYNKKILPYINNIYQNNTRWIKNILEKKEQVDKIVFDNKELMVVRDSNWNNNLKKDFYILAIPYERLKTIRDLTAKHIKLLLNMKNECIKIAKDYNLSENELYFFFHYHPSFYHLHLHCCIINHNNLSSKFFRCKMLDTVIENLNKSSFYYKNGTIKFEIPEKHVIVKLLND